MVELVVAGTILVRRTLSVIDCLIGFVSRSVRYSEKDKKLKDDDRLL